MILACSAVSGDEEPEMLDFSAGGNAILGAGCSSSFGAGGSNDIHGGPLFFSANHGLVTVLSNNAASHQSGGVPGDNRSAVK